MNRNTCREEVVDAARAIVSNKGINEFTVREIIEHLEGQGTTYKRSTIRTHVVSRCCTNAPDHHAVVYKDFERIRPRVYKIR